MLCARIGFNQWEGSGPLAAAQSVPLPPHVDQLQTFHPIPTFSLSLCLKTYRICHIWYLLLASLLPTNPLVIPILSKEGSAVKLS